jgi:hypothetical protein
MKNEAIPVEVPAKVYLDLAYQLRKSGDLRSPDQVVALAIRTWLGTRAGKTGSLGYQWKDLFLPDGTNLRMRYRGTWHYAAVEGDRLIYAGEPVSPRDWGLLVTGTVRNAWRDIWIRRSINDAWTRAAAWREPGGAGARPGTAERRQQTRRSTD